MHPSRQVQLGWLPVLIWMALIFLVSTDLGSAAHTSRFIEPLLRWLFRGRLNAATVAEVHHLIRKTAHLTEYAVLAYLAWSALRRSLAYPAVPALVLTAAYAASDEFHQSFVPSRGASVEDVLIDTAGATLGLLLLYACRALKQHWAADHPRPDKS